MEVENNYTRKEAIKMVIPCCQTYNFVKIREIIRCEGMQNYCRVYLTSGEVLTSTNSLGHFKRTLQEYGFVSCHRSHLVNKREIIKYYKDGSVELSDQSSVPVSRRTKESFLNDIMEDYINKIKQ